jgi:hypothetical protein
MTGILLYLKHVAGLLDRCYEREALLHAKSHALFRAAHVVRGAAKRSAHDGLLEESGSPRPMNERNAILPVASIRIAVCFAIWATIGFVKRLGRGHEPLRMKVGRYVR